MNSHASRTLKITHLALLSAVQACLVLLTVCSSSLLAQQNTGKDSGKSASYNPVIGMPHPDFILPGIADEKPVRLSDFRGKKVLLVHFASW